MPPKLFGTSGIRGSAEELFTDEFCIRIGYTFGLWLKSKHKEGFVAMAMDPRESSPRIKARVANGLAAAGYEILDEGVVPTPALTYFVKQNAFVAGGVMVTGSHISANLNGVKLLANGEEVTKQDEPEIEEMFANVSQIKRVEPIVKNESACLDLYTDMLRSLCDSPYPKWKIVVDTTNGTQTEVIRKLFRDLKISFTSVNDFDIQSPHFVPCDTEIPSMFTELVRQVLTTKADFGLAFDVDGDRVIMVDDLGRFIPGDYTCALLAQASNSKSIVTPISTSSVIDHIGKKVFRTPVGSTWVSAKMKTEGSTFGFEANGGSLNPEISYGRDGGVTAIKLLNLIKSSGQKLSQLYDSLPKYFQYREKIDCAFDKYPSILQRVKERYQGQHLEELDGLKIIFPNDSWLLFRGSGNAPEFKVFAESKSLQDANKLGQQGLALVKSIITHIRHLPGLGTDSLGVYAAIGKFPDQCQQVLSEMPLQIIPSECNLVDNIVVSGMGGSALGGRILASLERQVLRIPIIISTEYHLPNFVNRKTLVVISSYSGNTDESLFSLKEAVARNANIFIITSGGKLAQIAMEKKYPAYIFEPRFNPSNQPRLGLGYNIMALVSLLSRCQLITPPDKLSELASFLRSQQPSTQKLAQGISKQLVERIPVILASEHLKGVAHDFKNQLNENAKTMAAFFDLPEANHHLLEGLGFPRSNTDNLVGVFLNSSLYHREVQKRYPITEQVFKKQGIPCIEINGVGPSPFFEAMYLIQMTSYISFYVSQLNGIDPGLIPWVDYFKNEIH